MSKDSPTFTCLQLVFRSAVLGIYRILRWIALLVSAVFKNAAFPIEMILWIRGAWHSTATQSVARIIDPWRIINHWRPYPSIDCSNNYIQHQSQTVLPFPVLFCLPWKLMYRRRSDKILIWIFTFLSIPKKFRTFAGWNHFVILI